MAALYDTAQAIRELARVQPGEWMVCHRTNGHVVLALFCGLPFRALGPTGVLAQPWIRSQRRLSSYRNTLRFVRRPTEVELFVFGLPKGRPIAKAVVDKRYKVPFFEPLRS